MPASDPVTPDPPTARRGAFRWYALAAAVLVLDQLTKLIVLQTIEWGQGFQITGFFNLIHVRNPGAAFSFLADAGGWQRWLFAALALGISAALGVLIWLTPQRSLFCVAAALIIGGALGNLVDRLMFGEVIDFLDFHLAGWHWPAFNLADSGITVGAIILIADEWTRGKKDKHAHADSAKPPA